MPDNIEQYLMKVPVINVILKLMKKVEIPGFLGMNLYDLVKIYVKGIFHGTLSARAGGIAFSFLMAIFPFLIFILTLIKYIPIEGFQDDFIYLINQWLPPTTSDAVYQNAIYPIMNHNYGGVISLYFILSVIFMTNGITAIFGGFETSYHITVNRNFIGQYVVALGVSLLLALYLLATVLVAFYFEVAIGHLKSSGYVSDSYIWIQVGRKLFFALMLFISIATLYYYGTKEGKLSSFFSPGAIMTTLLFFILFQLFGIYVVKYSKYNELYGSIGTLLVFMLFIWLNSILLLLGFELNASLNQLKIIKKARHQHDAEH
ncbi:MAG: ribonuclease BN [Flavobacteriia bacterium]|nr:MAG: ribonuclease BN [Flavobacteriia bacterium]